MTILEGKAVLIKDLNVAVSQSTQRKELAPRTIRPRQPPAVCIVWSGVIVVCLLGASVSYFQQLLPGEWLQGVNLISPPIADTVFFFSFSENTSTLLPPTGSIVQTFTTPTLTQMNIRVNPAVDNE